MRVRARRSTVNAVAISGALMLHMPLLAPPIYNSQLVQGAVAYFKGRKADAEYQKQAEKAIEERKKIKQLAREGKIKLGEFILRANEIDLRLAGNAINFRKARGSYSELLEKATKHEGSGGLLREAHLIFSDYDYSGGFDGTMTDMLIEKSGKCNQITHIIVSVAASLGYDARIRVYSNHLEPIIIENGQEVDVTSGKPSYGKGLMINAGQLIELYDSENGGFSYPKTTDRYPGRIPLYNVVSGGPEAEKTDGNNGREKIEIPVMLELRHQHYFQYLDLGEKSGGYEALLEVIDPANLVFTHEQTNCPGRRFYGGARWHLTELSAEIDRLEAASDEGTSKVEGAYLFAVSVAMYQEVEYVAALLGKQRLVDTANRKKEDALEKGRKALIGATAEEVKRMRTETRNLTVDENSYLKYFAYLPPEGKDILRDISRELVAEGPSELRDRDLLSLFEIPSISEKVAEDISSLPIEQQIAIIKKMFLMPPNCQNEFCQVARTYDLVRGKYGLGGPALDYLAAGYFLYHSRLDFNNFFTMLSNGLPPGIRSKWRMPLMVDFFEDFDRYRDVNNRKSQKFVEEYLAWFERNK